MQVYLTSFFQSSKLNPSIKRWSGAVYQPKGYNYPKADCWDIRKDGKWIRPREFLEAEKPLIEYRNALWELYDSRRPQIEQWLGQHGWDEQFAAVCCWCPSDKAAKKQLDLFGSFVCHTSVVGEYLSEEMKIPVWYDSDRLKMAVLSQKSV